MDKILDPTQPPIDASVLSVQVELFKPDDTTPEEFTLNVLRSYADQTGKERDFDHPKRVLELMQAYCPDLADSDTPVGVGVTVATLLHDVFDRFSNSKDEVEREHALAAFMTVFSRIRRHTDVINEAYLVPVLRDMSDIEVKAESYRTTYVAPDNDIVLNTAIAQGLDIGLEPKHWNVDFYAMHKPEEMLDLVRQVNIESVIINAVEKLDNLIHPPKNEAALLQDVHEALYFYFPLLEILGLEELATALRSKALEIKLEKGGHHDLIEKAREMISDAHQVFDQFKEQLFPEYSVTKRKGSAAVYDSMGTLSTPEHPDSPGASIEWRFKSVGSLAKKLLDYTKSGKIIDSMHDVIGFNILGSTWQDSFNWIAGILAVMQSNKGARKIEFGTSQTNGDYNVMLVCGDGTKGLEQVKQGVQNAHSAVEVDYKTTNDGYEAYKLYLSTPSLNDQTKTVGIEIQFLPHQVHIENRVGVGSHVFKKIFATPEQRQQQAVYLREIRNRLKKLEASEITANGQSAIKAKETLGWLAHRYAIINATDSA